MKDLPTYWLCFVLIPYNLFAERIAEIVGSRERENIIFFILLLVYILLNFVIYKSIVIDKKIIMFLLVNMIICLEHVLQFNNYGEEIKHSIYIIILLLVASYSNEKCLFYMKCVIEIISCILVASAFMHVNEVRALNRRMFNIRNYTILDKPYYTLLLPLAIIILVHQIVLVKVYLKKISLLFLVLMMLYTLFAIFESKMGLIALIVAFLVEVWSIDGKFKYRLLAGVMLGMLAFTTFYLATNKQLPDYVIALFDFIFGDSKAVARVYYDSFYGRLEIIKIVGRILIDYPLLGCGFGQYYQYASSKHLQHYTIGNVDVESSFIAIFAEGGFIYAFICLILLGHIMVKIWNLYRSKNIDGEILALYVCMLFLLIGNDFMNVFFWIFLGIIWANVYGNRTMDKGV